MQNERKSPWAALLVLAVVVSPLLYPLSLGPAIWLYNHQIIVEESFLNPVYAPVEWAADRSPAFLAIMERYVDLWDGPAVTVPLNAPLPYVPPPSMPLGGTVQPVVPDSVTPLEGP